MYALPDKPQEIAVIINNGTRLLIAGIKQVAIILLIMLAIDVILFVLLGPDLAKISKQIAAGQAANIHYGELLSLTVPFMLVYILFNNAMIATYSAVANARKLTMSEALLVGIRKLLAVVAYVILYNLILAVSMFPVFILIALFQSQAMLATLFGLAAAVPLAILAVTLYFGNYLIVADDAGVIESLIRSYRLVRGNLLRAGIYVALITFIQFISMLTQFLSILFIPVVIAFIIPFIHDLKLRHDNSHDSGHFAA